MESLPNHLEHTIAVSAAPASAFRVIADAVNWPLVFLPTIHLDREDLGGGEERIYVWALVNDEVKEWTSVRNVDPDRLTAVLKRYSGPAAAGRVLVVEVLETGRELEVVTAAAGLLCDPVVAATRSATR